MIADKEKRKNPSPSSIPLDDPRYPIWGRLYLCTAPRSAFYSTEYLEQFGMHTSGNKAVDRGLFTGRTRCYLTIDQQVEYYHQHDCVGIVRAEDAKAIYEACQDYTFDAAERMQRSIFNNDKPFEDLIKIDEYAEAVYQHAAINFGREFAKTFVSDAVMKNAESFTEMFASIDKRLKDRKKQEKNASYTVHTQYSRKGADEIAAKKAPKEVEPLPERPSCRELFLDYMGNRGNR